MSNPFKHRSYLGHAILALGLWLIAGVASAAGTRVTPCDPATPNNAICATWNAITTDTNGNTITGVTYRVQRKTGSTGTYADVATGSTATTYYAKSLAVGTYFIRVYASCAACTSESDPSNEASGSATAIPVIPSSPVIIIAATINANGPPTYKIIQSYTLKPNEIVMVAPASMKPLFASR